jgi:protein-disulfide isomerase
MILNHAAKWTLSGVIALTALASVSAAAPRANWLLTFTETAAGGYIVGNPAAPTKLVEYASYTCGHCAEFENDVAPVLKAQNIAGGKVSFEIRNLVRDPYDLTIAMLARCGGKGRFFGNHKLLMASQKMILANAAKISPQTEAKLKAGNLVGFMTDAYTQLGLKPLAAQRGISDAAAKTCFADKAALQKVIAMTELSGTKYAIAGTPAFLVNDKLLAGGHDLASLQNALDAK